MGPHNARVMDYLDMTAWQNVHKDGEWLRRTLWRHDSSATSRRWDFLLPHALTQPLCLIIHRTTPNGSNYEKHSQKENFELNVLTGVWDQKGKCTSAFPGDHIVWAIVLLPQLRAKVPSRALFSFTPSSLLTRNVISSMERMLKSFTTPFSSVTWLTPESLTKEGGMRFQRWRCVSVRRDWESLRVAPLA